MRIPLPSMPRWLDRGLDWINRDLVGFKLGSYQPRRIDVLAIVLAIVAISLDGTFFNGWRYALLIDPWLFIFGGMVVAWFILGSEP